jgi:hypothetical protein
MASRSSRFRFGSEMKEVGSRRPAPPGGKALSTPAPGSNLLHFGPLANQAASLVRPPIPVPAPRPVKRTGRSARRAAPPGPPDAGRASPPPRAGRTPAGSGPGGLADRGRLRRDRNAEDRSTRSDRTRSPQAPGVLELAVARLRRPRFWFGPVDPGLWLDQQLGLTDFSPADRSR